MMRTWGREGLSALSQLHLSSLFDVTEPAIYGITLPMRCHSSWPVFLEPWLVAYLPFLMSKCRLWRYGTSHSILYWSWQQSTISFTSSSLEELCTRVLIDSAGQDSKPFRRSVWKDATPSLNVETKEFFWRSYWASRDKPYYYEIIALGGYPDAVLKKWAIGKGVAIEPRSVK